MTSKIIKKSAAVALACMMTTTFMTGCGSKSDKNPYASEEYNVDDYVTLGTYTGLSADQTITEVTDEDVQNEIDSLVEDNTTYTELTDVAAASGNRVTLNYTSKVNDEEKANEMDYQLELGSGDMGEEFENHIIGMAINDTITFTIQELAETDAEAETEAETNEDGTVVEAETNEDGTAVEETEAEETYEDVTYEVTLTKVEQKNVPEFTDDFVKENTESDSVEAYKTAKKAELEENNEKDAEDSAKADLLSQVVEASTITGSPAFLYNINYNSLANSYSTYAGYFGMDLDGYLEACGSSMDQLKLDAVDSTRECLVVESLAKVLNLDLTDDEYNEKIQTYVDEYGWESKEAIEEEFSKDELLIDMRKEKVLNYLFENSTINKQTVSADAE